MNQYKKRSLLLFFPLPKNNSFRSSRYLALALAVLFLGFKSEKKPLVVIIGDSIVVKDKSNGYAFFACDDIEKVAGLACDTSRSTRPQYGSTRKTISGSVYNFHNSVKPRAPEFYHYNAGIDIVNTMPKDEPLKIYRYRSFAYGLEALIGHYYRAIPKGQFIYASGTRIKVNAGTRRREDLKAMNDTIYNVCNRMGVLFNDLYKFTDEKDLPTSDGRHFNEANATLIGQQTAKFLVPLMSNKGPKVHLMEPMWEQSIWEGEELELKVELENSNATGVHYYSGKTKIASATSSPFSAKWKNAKPGRHFLTAEAVMADGKKVMSKKVPIVVAAYPLKVNFGGLEWGGFMPDKPYFEKGLYGWELDYSLPWKPISGPAFVLEKVDILNTKNDPIFVTYRTKDQRNGPMPMLYKFESESNEDVPVTLFLSDPGNQKRKRRMMEVKVNGSYVDMTVNGKTISSNSIDIIAHAGEPFKAITATFMANPKDGIIEFSFSRAAGSPKDFAVNAIAFGAHYSSPDAVPVSIDKPRILKPKKAMLPSSLSPNKTIFDFNGQSRNAMGKVLSNLP